ncbi:hypothetical protein [Psychrobacillus sp. FSL K6-1267]|uniref:hypothetical protein n=1 Tax=Psychrobacillus sp. FSL K6-1267 TaxID=2921543 RepID=UPI0030F7BE10
MENRDYKVIWNARGMDFNYNGTEKVWASNEEDVRERAVREVNRKMCISRQLINVETVEAV